MIFKKIFITSIFSILLLQAEIVFCNTPLKSNWKIFQMEFRGPEEEIMKVGWNGKRLVVKIKPLLGEGGYSLAKRILNTKHRSLWRKRRRS